MDREQEELQFLGFFGMIKESFRIVLSWRKIFSQITLALILPLSFIFLAHIQVSRFLFFNIVHDQHTLNSTEAGTRNYSKLYDIIHSEWIIFVLFKVAYFIFLLILSLLSTAAVVYTIACIYTAKPITFRKVMSVVPKVWKRLMITFLCSFAIVFVYNVAAGFIFFFLAALIGGTVGLVILIVSLIVYAIGFLYITIVWHLASVVSVLEDKRGMKAMVKSRNLLKGKMRVAVAVFITVGVFFLAIQFVFENFVVFDLPIGLGIRIAIGIVCFLLLLKVILFGLVIQTVLYLVCKSYHHENIDKSSLADHLEGYLGEYVPLKAADKDVQMEQIQV